MSSSKNFSLIIPAAADKPEFDHIVPHIFSRDKEGLMLCVKSLLGLNLESFDNVYFTVLRKHVEKYDVDVLLKLQLRRIGLDNAKIIILDSPTTSQAETVKATIEQKNITGSIFIKDADSSFRAEVFPENGVAVYPLEELALVDPRNKSYVSVDDMQYITNIIEKRVVSNLFSVGGYCFENVEDFINVYEHHKNLGPIYLSHLIYSMLLDGNLFRPIMVSEYNDWNL